MFKFYSGWILCLAIVVLFASKTATAQDTTSSAFLKDSSLTIEDIKDSIDLLFAPKSYFQFSVSYLSDNVYLGSPIQ